MGGKSSNSMDTRIQEILNMLAMSKREYTKQYITWNRVKHVYIDQDEDTGALTLVVGCALFIGMAILLAVFTSGAEINNGHYFFLGSLAIFCLFYIFFLMRAYPTYAKDRKRLEGELGMLETERARFHSIDNNHPADAADSCKHCGSPLLVAATEWQPTQYADIGGEPIKWETTAICGHQPDVACQERLTIISTSIAPPPRLNHDLEVEAPALEEDDLTVGRLELDQYQ